MTTDDCQAEKKGGVREGRIEKNSKKKKGLKKGKKRERGEEWMKLRQKVEMGIAPAATPGVEEKGG